MMNKDLLNKLDIMIPNPKCELNYQKDYELLIAIVLSAQSTDKRVNMVTQVLFNKYNIYSLNKANIKDIEDIIKPVGTYRRKAHYIKEIVKHIVEDYNGVVPNNRLYLESLPGIGHKTCNVFLANIYDVPAIAVDTHVKRISQRLGLIKSDDVLKIEHKLMKLLPKDEWSRRHHQLVLFGRYICKAIKPDCDNCLIKDYCKYQKK